MAAAVLAGTLVILLEFSRLSERSGQNRRRHSSRIVIGDLDVSLGLWDIETFLPSHNSVSEIKNSALRWTHFNPHSNGGV